MKYSFTVIAISETWVTELYDDDLLIPGYILFSKPRSSRGGGASLYVKENISCTIRPDLSIDTDGTCESIFIEISNYFKRKTIVGCLYRAPNNDMKLFNENFDGLLHKLDKEHASCIIAGDFNINLLNNVSHTDTTSFVDNMSQLTTLHWANVDIKLEWLDAETSRWPNIGAMQVSNIGNQFGVIRSAMQSSKLHFVGVLKCEYMKLAVLYHHPT